MIMIMITSKSVLASMQIECRGLGRVLNTIVLVLLVNEAELDRCLRRLDTPIRLCGFATKQQMQVCGDPGKGVSVEAFAFSMCILACVLAVWRLVRSEPVNEICSTKCVGDIATLESIGGQDSKHSWGSH